jgi:hypothetical protein
MEDALIVTAPDGDRWAHSPGRAGRSLKLGVERVDRVAIPVEHVLDRLADGPADGLGLRVQLVVGQAEQGGDELGA